jgi:hypothetical protein
LVSLCSFPIRFPVAHFILNQYFQIHTSMSFSLR